MREEFLAESVEVDPDNLGQPLRKSRPLVCVPRPVLDGDNVNLPRCLGYIQREQREGVHHMAPRKLRIHCQFCQVDPAPHAFYTPVAHDLGGAALAADRLGLAVHKDGSGAAQCMQAEGRVPGLEAGLLVEQAVYPVQKSCRFPTG